LDESGLSDREHLELVEGELISKMGKKRPHVNAVAVVHAWLIRVFGEAYVHQEAPVDVAPGDNPTSEPEPDLIVLTKPSWEIQDANPQASELRLVAEVSDTSLRFDLSTKARLYARAGIREYWVVDIDARRVVVHRDPRNGLYHSVTAYSEWESVAPLAAPDRAFPVKGAFFPQSLG
jgi:Uma2 family endonuclease